MGLLVFHLVQLEPIYLMDNAWHACPHASSVKLQPLVKHAMVQGQLLIFIMDNVWRPAKLELSYLMVNAKLVALIA